MKGFSMAIGGRGGSKASAGGRGRGRGTGCALFTVDEAPVRKLIRLDDASAEAAAGAAAEIDPLDAFMAGVSKEVAKAPKPAPAGTFQEKAGWEELESEDAVASYCEAFAEGTAQQNSGSEGSDEEPDGDEEGDRKRTSVAPLPRVEHSAIDYPDVQTDFYKPHPDITKLAPEQVLGLRSELGISATGPRCPSPVVSFAHLGLPASLMEAIRKHGYSKPTPIQAQTIPAGLMGLDVVGVAETGSGKTVSYLMPMLVHCIEQPELQKDEGPIGVVLCPTRELAIQVEKETFKFNKLLGLRSTTLAGGLSKKEQFKDIKKGSEIVIAVPGRMIDIMKMKGFNLRRCTFVVLDEADRMLTMGFEYQVRSIVQNIRPNRQTLLFSATLPPKTERLASDLLKNPIRVVVGQLGGVAATIKQEVIVLDDIAAKWSWLRERMEGMLCKGQLLIFVASKKSTEEMVQDFTDLCQRKSVALHGDLEQGERMRVLDSFRQGSVNVLIATDLAARGLDVPAIRTVVSYDAPRDIETHTHRVGRTGRAGVEGEAFTLLTDEKADRKMAAQLFTNLKQGGTPVSAALATLAQKHVPFRAKQQRAAEAEAGRAPENRCSRSRSRSR